MRFFLYVVAFIFLLSSCIPNKKIVYLQKGDVNRKNLIKDTVVRTYPLDTFSYRIQPHDALFVRFESVTDQRYDFLSEQQSGGNLGSPAGMMVNSQLVNDSGEITFPVIGNVKVSGLTIFEIQDKLQVYANQYLEYATVKVRLVNFRFTVLGEVNQEGTVTSGNNRITLPEAIGLSGGLTELADRSNIKVIRQINGTSEVFYVNLLDEGLVNSPYYYIYQNDILIVPPLRQRPFRRYFGQNLSLFLSTISVTLLVANLIIDSGSSNP